MEIAAALQALLLLMLDQTCGNCSFANTSANTVRENFPLIPFQIVGSTDPSKFDPVMSWFILGLIINK